MDVDEPSKIVEEEPKENNKSENNSFRSAENRKAEKLKTTEISEGLKNMFADFEGENIAKTPEANTESDGDENMEDVPNEPKENQVAEEESVENIPLEKEITPQPEEVPQPLPKQRKKKKVLKRTTKLDQLGYLVTHTEEVWESCSDTDNENVTSNPPSKSTLDTKPKPRTLKSVPITNKKKPKKDTKQESLMSFFKK